jgi:hypothetical protein
MGGKRILVTDEDNQQPTLGSPIRHTLVSLVADISTKHQHLARHLRAWPPQALHGSVSLPTHRTGALVHETAFVSRDGCPKPQATERR